MQAVIYARISRDREGAGVGVERQAADCRDLADRLGWTVVGTFTDNDVSAYSGKLRPGYRALLDTLEAGKAGAVLAWHTDRLHRSPVELEEFIDVCDRRGIDVRTVRAGTVDLSTASGKMVARMLGAAARHEVEHNIERQKRAKLQAALEGSFRGGRRSFGFEADGMTLRETEARAIRDATRRILAGTSIGQMVREWNEAGLVTAYSGKAWTSRDLRKVLTRPRNASLVTHEGEIVGSGKWPAIVDPDEWRALMALLSDPARRRSTSIERKYLGSGLYLCGKCGKPMLTATQVGSAARPRRVYKCSGGAHLGRIADRLDEYVTELTLARLSRDDAAIALGGPAVDAAALQTERAGVQARLDELAALFADAAIDGSQLRRGSETLRAQLAAIDQRLAEARASSTLADLVLAGDDLRAVWERLSVDVQAKVVDVLMTVTILPAPRGRRPGGDYFDPEYIRIDWKAGA
ncbi:recombinase family protein [Rhodococcus ruber]|uniref:recombinase family protein n=1 Tax=Rhodococcus ruber TaxID=1830 RepID=UPI00177D176B|nr:recombinase family protein [Rhodococcus ruber]MBD8054126.1 recombinase family protein [Rhodococcus ruber]WKK13023.1 recombinase family protein [Rhodococcus ruber]